MNVIRVIAWGLLVMFFCLVTINGVKGWSYVAQVLGSFGFLGACFLIGAIEERMSYDESRIDETVL